MYNNTSITPAKGEIPNDDKPSVKVKDPKKDPTNDKAYTEIKDKGTNAPTVSKDVQMYKMLYDSYAESGAEQNKAKGIGNFLEQSASKDVYLALVNDVETGQVIRVRNLMNNKVIYRCHRHHF